MIRAAPGLQRQHPLHLRHGTHQRARLLPLQAQGRQVGGYANTFLPVSTDWGADSKGKHDATDWATYAAQALPLRGDLPPDIFASHAEGWHKCGATVIGGCCGAGPEHIARLRSVLDAGAGKPAF